MTKMLDAALAYAAKGWPVFPCDGYKKPLRPSLVKGEGGVHDATTNLATIREWWAAWPDANIGCHLGAAGMMAVDLDPGHDMGEVHRAFEGLPETKLRQRTPRGGEHLFYALAADEKISPSGSKIAPHVDIRSWGSYVLLAPSRTLEGKGSAEGDYTWAHETAYPPQPQPKPAYRTEAMVKACGEKRKKASALTDRIIAEDLPESIAAAVAWIHSADCKPSVEGQGGNTMLYNTGAMMHSFGLSQATALDLIMRDYNPTKCIPEWEIDDIETSVDNAYRYHTSEFGNKSPAWMAARVKLLFKPATVAAGQGTERQSGRFRIVDGAGIDSIKAPEWLIPGAIPKGGHVTLSGAPGTFKSFVALDMLLSVACGSAEGRVWPNVVEAGPVLLMLGEGRSGMKARVKAWCDRYNGGKMVPDLFILDPVPLVSGGAAEWEACCDLALESSRQGFVLTAVDTATRAMAGVSQNATENASMLTLMVNTIQKRLDSAVLVVHHTGYGDQSRASGSFVFTGDPDTALVLSRSGKEMLVDIANTKQKDAAEWERPLTVKLEEIGGSLVVAPAPPRPPAAPQGKNTIAPAEAAITNVLDTLVVLVLKDNKLRAWTQRELSETLACREDVNVPSRTIDKKLRGLRENSSSLAGKHYDATHKRWRWRG